MAHRVRNVPSESSIQCPKCDKSYKGRTLKDHIEDDHKLLCLYTCTFPTSDGVVCNFSCGKRMSCINNHQSRCHNLNFNAKSEHAYTSDNYFAFGFKPVGKDEHATECVAERKYFKDESQKKVNFKQAEERAAARKIKAEAAAAARKIKAEAAAAARKIKAEASAAARKRKAVSAAGEKAAKRAKKSKVKETHAMEPWTGSAPLGKAEFPGKADEPKNSLVIAVGDSQKEEEPKKPENDDDLDDDITEAFFQYCYAEQDISDSESDDDEAKVKPKVDEVLLYTAGCGRFSPDVRQLCKAVRAEMQWKYVMTDPQGWKKYVRKLHGLWHPDKNAEEYSAKATVVFQCVQNEREILEN